MNWRSDVFEAILQSCLRDKKSWQIDNVLSRARTGSVMVCKLHRRQNPFPAKVPRSSDATPILVAIDSRDEPRPCFARNYESILVFPGFSTGTESTRRRAVNAPLHPAKKKPQRVRHLPVSPNIRPQRSAAVA